jgi:predicted  nucleic acid-binding Zn-ribbon protein
MMNKMMQTLFELQTLEFEEVIPAGADERIAALRGQVPKPILAHYDRLCDHGKKGVAVLRHQTCSGCHMQVPLGVALDLRAGVEVCLCGSCGRYLILEEGAAVFDKPAKKMKSARTLKQFVKAI